MRGALRGCLALVSRQPGAAPPPQPGDQQSSQQVQQQPAAQQLPAPDEAAAVELVRTCVSHVFIRALAAADRQLALRLLAAAMRGYGDALLGANLDLLEYTISSGTCRLAGLLQWRLAVFQPGAAVRVSACCFCSRADTNIIASASAHGPLHCITPSLRPCPPPAAPPPVDGEKDPRCLLLSFDAIQALLELYHRQPEEALCRERLEVRWWWELGLV